MTQLMGYSPSRVKYRWIEVDQADHNYSMTMTAPSGSISIPLPGGQVVDLNSGDQSHTIHYNPQDDFMGEAIVEFCDDSVWPGTEYSTGSFLFKDRKSTRLNSSHVAISYAVFCLKK